MAFERIYAEIKEMARSAMLETPMARAIARKAGVRLGGAGAGVATPRVLLSGTLYYGSGIFQPLGILHAGGARGVHPSTEVDLDPLTAITKWSLPNQIAWAELSGVAYVRVVISLYSGAAFDQAAYLPTYSVIENPMSYGLANPHSLSLWRLPDGRTLEDWHIDYGPDGPRTYDWPPLGALTYPEHPLGGANSGTFASPWSRPPLGTLGQSRVHVGMGVISANSPEVERIQDFLWQFQLQAVPESALTEAFLEHYAGRIVEP